MGHWPLTRAGPGGQVVTGQKALGQDPALGHGQVVTGQVATSQWALGQDQAAKRCRLFGADGRHYL